MGTESGLADLERLLADSAWLRRLAARLARPADAEDAVQSTWLTALCHPPDGERPARPWLATVLRHLLRRQGREQRRRHAREQEVAALAPAVAAPASDGFEQLELLRLLTGLVMELDEPFRSTVVQRYFEGRSGADIARAAGIPEGTVRWRLNEALKRLRRRLDERTGPHWRALALGFGKGVAMKVSTKVGVATVAVLLLAAGATGSQLARLAHEQPMDPTPASVRAEVATGMPVVRRAQSAARSPSRPAPPPRFEPAAPAAPAPAPTPGPPPARPSAAIPLDRWRDFTPDELDRMAANCEVRVGVPGLHTVNHVPMEWMDDRRLAAAGLHALEVPVVRDALADYRNALTRTVRRWHGAVAGDPDVARTVDYLDYTTGDHPAVRAMSASISMHQISEGARQAALELAGRTPAQSPRDPKVAETAAMYRQQLELARRFEASLAGVLGPARARVLMDGPLSGRTRRAGCM